MKKLVISVILMSCLCSQAYSRDGNSIGIRGGLAVPFGDLTSVSGPGVHFGIIARMALSSPNFRFALGGGVTFLSSKWQAYPFGGSYQTDYNPISLFAGLHIGKEKGAYFLPAVAMNASDDGTRIGFDMSVGILEPVSDGGWCADLGMKLSLLNLVMKETDEETNALFTAYVGLAF